jgi:ketosteroid isomerase-like protein
MTRHHARDFAEQWAAAWNARAVEQVLARFADGVVFLSPLAVR